MEISQELKKSIEENIDSKQIIQNSQKISIRYRTDNIKKLKTIEEVQAYTISRMPATYCAVYSAMKHVLEKYTGKFDTLLDIGAGTGAATWAINELINIKNNICLEQESIMIDIGKKLMNNTKLSKTEWKQFNIKKDQIKEKSDIVVTSYMINEIETQEKENVINKLWEATNKILLIVEPGTPEGFKNILKIREILLNKGANIIAPCANKNKCPIEPNDWCSFYVRVARSGIHRQAKNGVLGYEDEKFSYIAFSKDNIKSVKSVILRHPQINQGYIKLKVCTPNGIEEKTISKKEKEIYKISKKLNAGDFL